MLCVYSIDGLVCVWNSIFVNVCGVGFCLLCEIMCVFVSMWVCCKCSRSALTCCGVGRGFPFPLCCQHLSSEQLPKDVLPESSLTSHAFLCPRLQNSVALSSVGVALGSHDLLLPLGEDLQNKAIF